MEYTQIDDILFESKLEKKLKKCYMVPGGASEDSYQATSRFVANMLKILNRDVGEGILLIDEYCALAEDRLNVENVGQLAVSTLSAMGMSGLTSRMAVDIIEGYSSMTDKRYSAHELSCAANSTLETIKETYHSPKFALMLIEEYPASIKGVYSLYELSSCVNKTLNFLGSGHFKRDEVRGLIEAYNDWSVAGAETITEMCDAVCRTVEYAKSIDAPLRLMSRSIKNIAIGDMSREYTSQELCDLLTGKPE